MASQSPSLRNLYRPIQPGVDQHNGKVIYREFAPANHLKHLIYCYWELKTHSVLEEPFSYRVVSDGCIDVLFRLEAPEANFVSGFSKQFVQFELPDSFHYVGIRFLPTAFPLLFQIDASELFDRFEDLGQVVPKLSKYIRERFRPEMSDLEICAHFDAFFTAGLLERQQLPDPRLLNAMHHILSRKGALQIERDLDIGLSPRQLRRLFKFYVGDSAKTFSQVVRFQHVLEAIPSKDNDQKAFYDLGYYDQAHFIKEFKSFYGQTPQQAFQK